MIDDDKLFYVEISREIKNFILIINMLKDDAQNTNFRIKNPTNNEVDDNIVFNITSLGNSVIAKMGIKYDSFDKFYCESECKFNINLQEFYKKIKYNCEEYGILMYIKKDNINKLLIKIIDENGAIIKINGIEIF